MDSDINLKYITSERTIKPYQGSKYRVVMVRSILMSNVSMCQRISSDLVNDLQRVIAFQDLEPS